MIDKNDVKLYLNQNAITLGKMIKFHGLQHPHPGVSHIFLLFLETSSVMSGARKVMKQNHGNNTKHTYQAKMNTVAVERCRNSVDWGQVWFVLVCHPNMIEICQDHVRKSVEFVSLLLEFATGRRFF